MAGFNINDLLNAKSKGAAVQAEGPAEQEQEFKVTMLDVEDLMPVSYTHLTLPTT